MVACEGERTCQEAAEAAAVAECDGERTCQEVASAAAAECEGRLWVAAVVVAEE